MSDSDSESKHSSSTTPDLEAPEDPEGPKKNYSDPKHLFHRPYRKSLLRPSGMVLTKLDRSLHMLLDNAQQEDEQFVKRTVSRQSRLREGASSRTQNLDSASDGCQTEGRVLVLVILCHFLFHPIYFVLFPLFELIHDFFFKFIYKNVLLCLRFTAFLL